MQAIRPALCSNLLLTKRNFTTSTTVNLIQKWRKERGLPMNPTKRGVLTDSPDYTFLDGRITPYGQGQRERILEQHQVKMDIINLTKEIDFAVDRHNKMLEDAENKKKAILDRKLKPKGLELLKKVKTSDK